MFHAPLQSHRGSPSTLVPSVASSTARRVGLSGTRARGSPFARFPEEAHSAQRTADALCTEAQPLLKAQSVRFPFDRPAVPSNGRALSFFRAGVTPIEPSESAPHLYIWAAHSPVYSFLDFESGFKRFLTGFGVLCSLRWWRFREGAHSVGPGLGARLHPGPAGGDVPPLIAHSVNSGVLDTRFLSFAGCPSLRLENGGAGSKVTVENHSTPPIRCTAHVRTNPVSPP